MGVPVRISVVLQGLAVEDDEPQRLALLWGERQG